MKTSKLPPELVEKYKMFFNNLEDADKCAQIAVYYRESEIAVLETDKAMLESELHSVKQQRDELLEALVEVKESLNKIEVNGK